MIGQQNNVKFFLMCSADNCLRKKTFGITTIFSANHFFNNFIAGLGGRSYLHISKIRRATFQVPICFSYESFMQFYIISY